MYLSENVDQVEHFTEDELEDVLVVCTKMACEVVHDQGSAVLHCIGIGECGLVHAMD